MGRTDITCGTKATGASLLEVMIALFMMSIGILGTTVLQLKAKHSNFEAVQRTTASMLVNDIVERMRTNKAELATYVASGALVGDGSITSEPTPECHDVGTLCNPFQLATHDLWEWEQGIDGNAENDAGNPTGGLQFPSACIDGPATGGSGAYTVALAWRGKTNMDNPTGGSTCGQGSGKYDDDSGTADVFRRLLTVQFYVDVD